MPSFSASSLNQAAWLVYINGLEIPVSRVDVTCAVGQPSTISLKMFPHQLLQKIGSEDRLQVAVFYLDQHWIPEHPEFCLLGEFEITGWGYSNSGYGRSLQLNGVSHLNIFSQLHFFFISSLEDIVTSLSVEGTDTSSASVVKPIYPASLFNEGLTNSTGEDQFIKRPIDFVWNIFKAFLLPVATGKEDPTATEPNTNTLAPTAASAPGKNFYSRWLKMTNFHRRWAALPLLEDSKAEGCFPLLKAAQETQVLESIKQSIGQSIGNAGTAWDLLQQVFNYMLMEIITIPSPPSAVTQRETLVTVGRPSTLNNDFDYRTRTDQVLSIPTYYVKPQSYFALPPTCNVIFPSMLVNFSFEESYVNQPTRLYLGESFISGILNNSNSASVSTLISAALVTGFPLEVKARQKALLGLAQSNNKNFLLFPEEYYRGPVCARLNAPPWMYLLSQQKKATDTSEDINADMSMSDTSGLGVMFDKYAEYEYYRMRYSAMSGGASTVWNPYIVPGLPGVVFDECLSAASSVGYVTSVTHSMTADGAGSSMSTNVSLGCMRPIAEMMGLTQDVPLTAGLDIAPAEPIDEVSDAFQKLSQTNELYKRMFFNGWDIKRPTVFNWRDMVEVQTDAGAWIQDASQVASTVTYLKVKPTSQYEDLFKDGFKGMQYASRPVCTLKDYIETWHGRPLEDLIADSTVRGEYRSFYSPAADKFKSRGAVFWGRIYTLMQGPGTKPPVEVSNMGDPPEYGSAGPGNMVLVDTSSGMPQTRKNWDARLEEYRKIVRNELGHIAPQD
jgi:hypothetical protein